MKILFQLFFYLVSTSLHIGHSGKVPPAFLDSGLDMAKAAVVNENLKSKDSFNFLDFSIVLFKLLTKGFFYSRSLVPTLE